MDGSHRTVGFSEPLDIFRLHPVDPGQVAVSRFYLVQKMIQFRVDGLSISMSCALDKHGHHPCRKRGHSMPFQGLGRRDKPNCGIHCYHKENTGTRRQYTHSGEKSTNVRRHQTKKTCDYSHEFRKLPSLCAQRHERKQTTDEVSKAYRCRNRGELLPGTSLGGVALTGYADALTRAREGCR